MEISEILTVAGALIIPVMAVLKVIVNITPSEKDNKIFEKIDKLLDAIIPNLKKGGGTHNE